MPLGERALASAYKRANKSAAGSRSAAAGAGAGADADERRCPFEPVACAALHEPSIRQVAWCASTGESLVVVEIVSAPSRDSYLYLYLWQRSPEPRPRPQPQSNQVECYIARDIAFPSHARSPHVVLCSDRACARTRRSGAPSICARRAPSAVRLAGQHRPGRGDTDKLARQSAPLIATSPAAYIAGRTMRATSTS